MSIGTYIQITFNDGTFCVCESQGDADFMTSGLDGHEFAATEIEMTREQFDALPEFEA